MRQLLSACWLSLGACLVVPLGPAKPKTALDGLSLARVSDGTQIDMGAALASTAAGERTLLVFGTHAADFNTVEYAQRVRCALPELRAAAVTRCLMVINGEPTQCSLLAELLGCPLDEIELLADPTGEAGRRFGVSRGFRPDDASLSPFIKLFVVGIGLGPPWGTLAPVLSGYIGSPSASRDWIEASLRQGQLKGRWPNPLELSEDEERRVVANAFDNTLLVSGWGRRPFELATLRLQNLIMQLQNWDALKPVDDRCLTQLGGCTVVGAGGEPAYSWVDRGLCDVPEMEDILQVL